MSGSRRSATGRGRVTRLMLDTNVFDELASDAEAVAELENRRDLRLIVTEVQLRQLEAIPDQARRSRYLELAGRLCGSVAASLPAPGRASGLADRAEANRHQTDRHQTDRHQPDRMIASAALARCDILVTNDKGLLDYARRASVVAMDWRTFLRSMLYRAD